MRTGNKYRFSLQFVGDTEEKIRIGEMLEQSGNKKSVLILAALTEYRERHSGKEDGMGAEQTGNPPTYVKEDMEQMIEKAVEAKMRAWISESGIAGHLQAGQILSDQSDERIENMVQETTEDDVSAMIDNLDMFQ